MNSEYLSHRLLSLSGDEWTVDDAMKGTSIMGGTGSGKTTASGKKLAHTFLKEGWGGLVLCAKTDEADLWKKYCKETGREKDLIIFGKGSVHPSGEEMIFNPIDYEMKREGEGAGETQNIVNIFMNIYRIGNRISGGSDTKEERYWDTALKRCLNRVIELIKLSGEDLTYTNMVNIISSCDSANEDTFVDGIFEEEHEGNEDNNNEDEDNEETPDPKTTYCLDCLVNAYDLHMRHYDKSMSEVRNAFDLVEDYFNNAMPKMGDKTKSVVTESFMGLAEPFLSGLLYRHFSGATNIFPEWTYEQNKIIVLNFPIKEYLDIGVIAQSVFKLLFQQAVERRNIQKYPTPVFLWCDEAQYFVNPYDQIFLTTARSSRTATVFLSQNISNYFAVIGSGGDAKAKIDSLMGNLCTKIFHANSDAVTNKYASELIGDDLRAIGSSSIQQNSNSLHDNRTVGYNMHLSPQILPKEFTTLASGGEANNYKVEGVMMVSGKKWADGKNFKNVVFTQNFN